MASGQLMPALITFAFDPLLHLGDNTIRLETVALAAIILVGLLLLLVVARVTPVEGPYVPAPTLRFGDLPFLILGVVPGAVVGGRLDYVLVHLDFYAAHPEAVFDPTQGALGLGLAVPGAIIGGTLIARLVDAPLDRWLHASVMPMLFMLGAGKLAGVLSATGQGALSTLPWATAYTGDGPWNSLAAYLPAQPSQVYEAIGCAAILVFLGLAIRAGAFSSRNGTALLIGLVLWAIIRGFLVLTWRDETVLGPLRAEQLVMIGVIVFAFVAMVRIRAR